MACRTPQGAEVFRPMVLLTLTSEALVRVNPSFSQQFGYTADDLGRQPLLDWIHPSDREHFEQVMRTGGCTKAHLQTKDGGWVLLDWTVRLSDNTTAVLGLLGQSDVGRTEPAGS